MASLLKIRKTLFYLLYFIFITLLISLNKAQETITSTDPSYYYNLCTPSRCNNLTLTYPFTLPSLCHPSPLQPTCPNNLSLLLTSPRSTDTFRVLYTNFSTTPTTTAFFVASNSLFNPTTPNTPCLPVSNPNYASDATIFSLSIEYTPGTHLNCTSPIQGVVPVSCLGCPGQDGSNVCYYAPGFVTYPNCETYHVFTLAGVNVSAVKDLRAYFRLGFQLRYVKPLECRGCETSGGRCGATPSSGSFVCFCPSSVHRFNCSDGMIEDISTWVNGRGGGSGLSKAVVAAISASASLLLVLIVLVGVFFVRRRKSKFYLNKERISNISPTRYSYSQIKKFTNNFSTKLGEGGYGNVYKGTIRRRGAEVEVAIKILKKSKQTEKQFMNEVATVGSVHHQHLLCLLGYCAQDDTRALVYEFMEKGSLDEYIYQKKKGEGEGEGEGGEDKTNFKWLSPKQMYNIALETARGILYLHQGCRSMILHCDIKPHNVLLDSNFSAKVADFGLAKMIDKDQSHVSLTTGRGTPGYAAPEMWLKTLGSITEKSDVYSYGVLLLEMVGRRKSYDPNVADGTQVYFPEWVFNKIERGEKGYLNVEIGGIERDVKEEGDEEVLERMSLVGLWCIQHIPSNRPSMDRVMQMLEGNVEIGIPPHPFPHKNSKTTPESSSQDSLVYFSVASGSGSGSGSKPLDAR